MQPYLRADLWHTFAGDDIVGFQGTPIVTEREATLLQIGAGLSAQASQTVGLYASLSYTTDLDSTRQKTFQGSIGVRLAW